MFSSGTAINFDFNIDCHVNKCFCYSFDCIILEISKNFDFNLVIDINSLSFRIILDNFNYNLDIIAIGIDYFQNIDLKYCLSFKDNMVSPAMDINYYSIESMGIEQEMIENYIIQIVIAMADIFGVVTLNFDTENLLG
jgi:hypothetical protein